MARKIYFAMALHNHQPVGNFDHVFENSYQSCYKAFLDVLEGYPDLRISLHYSGPLLDWLEENHPDLIERLRRLVDAGQVEIMGGAYYEPILPLLPDQDRAGQISMQREYSKKTFGCDPKGFWLAERVWEQGLVSCLADNGVEYTLVDDSHFKFAGIRSDFIAGRYISEDRGRFISVFPMDEKLRYFIPFKDPEDTIEYLDGLASQGAARLMVYADDGEKFGSWPQTYKHIYEDKWLARFLDLLSQNSDWIEVITLAEALERIPHVGKIYIPDASYREMMAWALPAETHEELEDLELALDKAGMFERSRFFIKGAIWRNFQSRYAEASEMYGKMLSVSRMVEALSTRSRSRREATRLLYQAQCNCPYWHGVFGGLYLPHLRMAVYDRLIRAESLALGTRGRGISVEYEDRNLDGRDEIVVDSGPARMVFKPDEGAHMFEYDLVDKAYNVLATLTRRRESYHRAVLSNTAKSSSDITSIHGAVRVKDPHVRQKIVYDWYKKESLVDHFFGPGTELKNLSRCRFKELGDFVNMPYEVDVDISEEKARISAVRHGGLWMEAGRRAVTLSKNIMLEAGESEIKIAYDILNESHEELEFDFGVEFNYAMLGGEAPDRYYLIGHDREHLGNLSTMVERDSCGAFAAVDEWKGIEWWLEFSVQAGIWAFPVHTASMSEYGVELVYQCSSVVPHWRFGLAPQETWSVVVTYAPRSWAG